MNRRRPQHRSLLLCLTRRERAELSDINRRLNGLSRISASLRGRRDFILLRVPDHKTEVPVLPSDPTSPIQPSLF